MAAAPLRRCLELALEADVSARHLQLRRETDAHASRDMLLHLTETTRRAALLRLNVTHTSCSPPVSRPSMANAASMILRSKPRACSQMVPEGSEPFPALAVDL